MAKFQSKPFTIEAFQLTREWALGVLCGPWPIPAGLTFRGSIQPQAQTFTGHFVCLSSQGEVTAEIDDWIIDEPHAPGLCYPCKPDVFAAKYEAVDESAAG